jgi:hypothetical protein
VLHAQKLAVEVQDHFAKCLEPLKILCCVGQKSKDLSKFTSPTQVKAFYRLLFGVIRRRILRRPFHHRTPRHSSPKTTVAMMR